MGVTPSGSGADLPAGHSAQIERDESELASGTMVGEYCIEGTLGEGGMGRVYSATHPVIAKRAAIKVLHFELSVHREAVDRFVQEARAVNQIGHPNIVDIFSFGTLPDGRSYFVMEWLRGQSLRERIAKSQVPLADVLSILETVSIALEAAHEKGIIHRDLKPDNIFLVEVKGDKPTVKLLDFGIAKLTGGDSRVERTRTGNLMGTPAYISPEQARGHAIDHRTDIYALGGVAYELLTGDLPFPADNAADMIAKHLFADPPSAAELNGEVTPELDELVKRLLAKKPEERPTLEETREALRAIRGKLAYQMMGGHDAGGYTEPNIPSVTRTSGGTPIHTPPPGTRTPTGIRIPPQITPTSAAVKAAAANAQTAKDSFDTIPAQKSKTPLIIVGGLAVVGIAIGVIAATMGGDKPKPAVVEPARPSDVGSAAVVAPTGSAAGDPAGSAASVEPGTGSADAGSADAGSAGSADAGSADAGSADAGSADAGSAATKKPVIKKPVIKKPVIKKPKDPKNPVDPDAPM